LSILALDESEWLTPSPGLFTPVHTEYVGPRAGLSHCSSTFVRPRPGKYFFSSQDEGPVPTDLLVNTFPFFFKFIH